MSSHTKFSCPILANHFGQGGRNEDGAYDRRQRSEGAEGKEKISGKRVWRKEKQKQKRGEAAATTRETDKRCFFYSYMECVFSPAAGNRGKSLGYVYMILLCISGGGARRRDVMKMGFSGFDGFD